MVRSASTVTCGGSNPTRSYARVLRGRLWVGHPTTRPEDRHAHRWRQLRSFRQSSVDRSRWVSVELSRWCSMSCRGSVGSFSGRRPWRWSSSWCRLLAGACFLICARL